MKLDANALRYLCKDDWRILTAIEIGQKSHELVPTPLIESIAKLRHGGAHQRLSTCLKHKLIHHEASKYDGYRLTTLGYDFLAIHTLTMRGVIVSVGRQIGVGKESDIFEVAGEDGTIMALKLHRLGRTSFRAVKQKRDYLRKGNHYSWLYLSRLAAIKEYAFMKALGERGLPVPVAIDQNRHAVLMEKVEGRQLSQLKQLDDPNSVFEQMIDIMCEMVRVGLVHCDFNEFNVLLSDDGTVTAIDFPQMVSVSHANAEALFQRDLDCIVRFFAQKMKYSLDDCTLPQWENLMKEIDPSASVDIELHASGFNHSVTADRVTAEDSSDESLSDSSDQTLRNSSATSRDSRCNEQDVVNSNDIGRENSETLRSFRDSCTVDVEQHDDLVQACNEASADCLNEQLADESAHAARIQGAKATKQAALAKLHRNRKQDAQRRARSSRNSAKQKGKKKSAVSVLDM